jgi:hypothetical protein
MFHPQTTKDISTKFGIRTVCIKFVRRVTFLFILVQYNLFYIWNKLNMSAHWKPVYHKNLEEIPHFQHFWTVYIKQNRRKLISNFMYQQFNTFMISFTNNRLISSLRHRKQERMQLIKLASSTAKPSLLTVTWGCSGTYPPEEFLLLWVLQQDIINLPCNILIYIIQPQWLQRKNTNNNSKL